MLSRFPTNSIVLVALGSALLTATMLVACGSEEVGPADGSEASDDADGLGGTAATSKSGSSTARGGSSTNSGVRTTEQGRDASGGRAFGQGGSSTRRFGQGGFASNQGGFPSFLQGGSSVAGPTCRGGLQSGAACNPEFDTTECRRQTRVCQCDATTSQWNCTQNTGSGGGTSATSATGGHGPGQGGGGLAGSSGAPQNLAGTTHGPANLAGQPAISVAGRKTK